MPASESETYLFDLSERSFLKLWTLRNPHRGAGKETADLLVAFGSDVIVFSDKACAFDSSNLSFGWKRWYKRTISASLKQLAGAARTLRDPQSSVFIDRGGDRRLPFDLPEMERRRLHLISVVRPDRDPTLTPTGWRQLLYVDREPHDQHPFEVGRTFAKGDFVHVFDGQSLELLLSTLDTAPDFLCYLKSREHALRVRRNLRFAEPDLLALATSAWNKGRGFVIELPDRDSDGLTVVPSGLWEKYVQSERADRTCRLNADSKVIDRLIDRFHTEYESEKNLHISTKSYVEHEKSMRILASEDRFGRRIVATALIDIIEEEKTDIFWASTTPSKDIPGVRYVWLTYPDPPESVEIEKFEDTLLQYLRAHLIVTRATFPADFIVGIALPNREAKAFSYIITILDGSLWTTEDEDAAAKFRAQGIMANLHVNDLLHIP